VELTTTDTAAEYSELSADELIVLCSEPAGSNLVLTFLGNASRKKIIAFGKKFFSSSSLFSKSEEPIVQFFCKSGNMKVLNFFSKKIRKHFITWMVKPRFLDHALPLITQNEVFLSLDRSTDLFRVILSQHERLSSTPEGFALLKELQGCFPMDVFSQFLVDQFSVLVDTAAGRKLIGTLKEKDEPAYWKCLSSIFSPMTNLWTFVLNGNCSSFLNDLLDSRENINKISKQYTEVGQFYKKLLNKEHGLMFLKKFIDGLPNAEFNNCCAIWEDKESCTYYEVWQRSAFLIFSL
jgi:hypothetical protein